jgi:hypothetical protein
VGGTINLPTRMEWALMMNYLDLNNIMVSLYLTAGVLLTCVLLKLKLGVVSPLGFVHLGGSLDQIPSLLLFFFFFNLFFFFFCLLSYLPFLQTYPSSNLYLRV